MTTFIKDFPFEEIRRPDGNYFDTWEEVREAGYGDNQIWSIVEGEGEDEMDPDDPDYEPSGVWVYGPPHHWVNIIGFIATKETHDFDTYYEDRF